MESKMAVRKNFEFDERYNEMIGTLKNVCGLKTETSVIEEALVLLAWAAAEASKGSKIGSFDEQKQVLREITSPALEKARTWKVSPETEKARSSNSQSSYDLPLKSAM
jgi:hypothetical protein